MNDLYRAPLLRGIQCLWHVRARKAVRIGSAPEKKADAQFASDPWPGDRSRRRRLPWCRREPVLVFPAVWLQTVSGSPSVAPTACNTLQWTVPLITEHAPSSGGGRCVFADRQQSSPSGRFRDHPSRPAFHPKPDHDETSPSLCGKRFFADGKTCCGSDPRFRYRHRPLAAEAPPAAK